MKNRSKGFSLIDVLVAMLILAFILLSIAQLIIVALNSENNARHNTTLLYYGQQKLEELMNLPSTHPQLSVYDIIPDLQTSLDCPVATDRNSYCFDYGAIDVNHKEAPPSGYYFMAWSVSQISTSGELAVTLYIVPTVTVAGTPKGAPVAGGFKAPVTLTSIIVP